MSPEPTRDPAAEEDRPTFVTHLECGLTGEAYEADTLHGLSRLEPKGGMLLVKDEGRCPVGGATLAAYNKALAAGRVQPGERAVLFNCATGLKYPMPPVTARLDRHQPIDYAAL